MARVALFFLLLLACRSDQIEHSPLPERTEPPDTSALTEQVRTEGGGVLIELTGWVSSDVIEEFVEAGLRPLPGYDRVERLDSLGLNVVGGTVSPEALDRILEFSYVARVRVNDADS